MRADGTIGVDGRDFRALGPLEVWVAERPLGLPGPRLRTLLALLMANCGRVVSVDAIVAALWEIDAPPDAHRTARTYVSRLRRALRPAANRQPPTANRQLIVTHPAGYQLRLPPDLLDVARFERLATAGRQSLATDQPAAATEQLSAALALWRGDAYGESPTSRRCGPKPPAYTGCGWPPPRTASTPTWPAASARPWSGS